MANNTQLNSNSSIGDIIRTIDKSGNKTQSVVLDVGGSGTEQLLTLGQQPTNSSLPVVIASNQSAIPISGNLGRTWTLSNTTDSVNASIIGTVPVSGTFWQTTQPVSLAQNVTVNSNASFGVTSLPANATVNVTSIVANQTVILNGGSVNATLVGTSQINGTVNVSGNLSGITNPISLTNNQSVYDANVNATLVTINTALTNLNTTAANKTAIVTGATLADGTVANITFKAGQNLTVNGNVNATIVGTPAVTVNGNIAGITSPVSLVNNQSVYDSNVNTSLTAIQTAINNLNTTSANKSVNATIVNNVTLTNNTINVSYAQDQIARGVSATWNSGTGVNTVLVQDVQGFSSVTFGCKSNLGAGNCIVAFECDDGSSNWQPLAVSGIQNDRGRVAAGGGALDSVTSIDFGFTGSIVVQADVTGYRSVRMRLTTVPTSISMDFRITPSVTKSNVGRYSNIMPIDVVSVVTGGGMTVGDKVTIFSYRDTTNSSQIIPSAYNWTTGAAIGTPSFTNVKTIEQVALFTNNILTNGTQVTTISGTPTINVTSSVPNQTVVVNGGSVNISGTVPVTLASNVTINSNATVGVTSLPANATVNLTSAIPSGTNTIGNVGIVGTVPVSGTFWQTTQPVSLGANVTLNPNSSIALLGGSVNATIIGTVPVTIPLNSTVNISNAVALSGNLAGVTALPNVNISNIFTNITLNPNSSTSLNAGTAAIGNVTAIINALPTGTNALGNITAVLNALPTGGNLLGGVKLTDNSGTNNATVKAASTAVVAGDTALAVGIHPSTPLPTGTNTLGNITAILNALPTGANVLGGIKLTDTAGTTNATVKAASTAAVFTDTAVVADVRPGGALVTASAALADALANPILGRVAVLPALYNSATWDLQRGMSTALTTGDTGAKTATGNGATITNVGNKGMQLVIVLGTVSGTSPTCTFKLQSSVDGGTNWVDIPGAATGAIATTGVFGISVYPGQAVTAGTTVTGTTATASGVLPRTWRVVWTIGGTTPSFAITSITYNYLPN